MDLTKKEIWDALRFPNVERSCWNCKFNNVYNTGQACQKPGVKLKMRKRCQQDKANKKRYWKWNRS